MTQTLGMGPLSERKSVREYVCQRERERERETERQRERDRETETETERLPRPG